MYLTEYSSPLGSIFLASDGTALVGLWMEGQKYFAATLGADVTKNAELPVFRQIMDWLDAYFEKRPLPALPPLAPKGSDFRQAVWKLLLQIPYGEVTTYGELAHALQAQGISAAAQAVGGAVGHNPISIIIPCLEKDWATAAEKLLYHLDESKKSTFRLVFDSIDSNNIGF